MTSERAPGPRGKLEAIWLHMRRMWPRWTLVPALPFVLYTSWCLLVRGERRWELVAILLIGAIFPYATEGTKRLFIGISPIGWVALLYDSMRFFKNVGISAERIHICDLRHLDAALFGLTMGGERVSIHDWFQLHATPGTPAYWPIFSVVDVIAAIPYGTFIGAAFLFAFYLWKTDFEAMRRFTTAFFFMNLLGFITYHVVPAAPPWWFHQHGCVADLSAHASEGPNLARVDVLLGFRYFGNFYGRSNDVFGAVPSLHVAYPLLIMLEGWSKWIRFPSFMRIVTVLFFVTMAFAAVYLDHHWVVDVLLGIVYASGVFLGMRKLWAWRDRVTASPDQVPAREPAVGSDAVAR